MAAELGFEPRQTVSETGVLPLHNSAVSINDQRSIANHDSKINMGTEKYYSLEKCLISRLQIKNTFPLISSVDFSKNRRQTAATYR